ncbi:hypothetical protein LshimejAT787_1502380 [Lyophyllum shimeji]|uniref:Uncharacterized protein n=1 Tax=Lyophyllum shimeji TaxID=47721 RepID=A0A9P3PYY0_LYOSH|nr:hypothetical protein LshimejAT787_1502380 [Lyophyllum shimeji]
MPALPTMHSATINQEHSLASSVQASSAHAAPPLASATIPATSSPVSMSSSETSPADSVQVPSAPSATLSLPASLPGASAAASPVPPVTLLVHSTPLPPSTEDRSNTIFPPTTTPSEAPQLPEKHASVSPPASLLTELGSPQPQTEPQSAGEKNIILTGRKRSISAKDEAPPAKHLKARKLANERASVQPRQSGRAPKQRTSGSATSAPATRKEAKKSSTAKGKDGAPWAAKYWTYCMCQ